MASSSDNRFTKGKQPRLNKVTVLSLCIGVALTIFVVDVIVPRGINLAALYVVPIILLQSASSTLYTALMAVLCGILAAVAIVFSPDIGVPFKVVLADYAIILIALVATTMLGVIANRRSIQLQTVSKLLTMCAWTKKVRVRGEWIEFEDYLRTDLGVTITHGMSEEMATKLLAEMRAKN